ncbi:glycerol-3-phosphate dehydrogenase (NAD+) [Fonticula alba]|uniref:Glycerol-3-phosphate dehydrogenase [NAD(+)] n=1 Tax=Fonticula alba TaxID=691883 RepID=A0A058Z6Y8_FONAL|nr:glycerol-3-phosphate dehydrogenase (NAD+) [Fonticula alba]KCV70005.1 glycerol-3-phosphate dehydrogenase (NAD+) [Fonticula alba]|eukprot:XP_009495611.1 glycerol-3-phosphate dehydrogenase (NAD+) [Fonticula alba]
MWVFEETLADGSLLTKTINERHENTKYLPGYSIPENVIADPCLRSTVADADLLVFVLPHQFLRTISRQITGVLKPGARAISLIKGLDTQGNDIRLITDVIRETCLPAPASPGAEVVPMSVSALSGANVAHEVAAGQFCETTIGYHHTTSLSEALVWKALFNTPVFRVSCVPDLAGVELCGALKNVVALAAGFSDGMNQGGNTKAAVMRIGLLEIRDFAARFYRGIRHETFFESCGMADLITSCVGGRNWKVAREHAATGQDLASLEQTMLNGQKLQGILTAEEVYNFLSARGLLHSYPLFTAVHRICIGEIKASDMLKHI